MKRFIFAFCLFSGVVFSAELPREIIRSIKFLARADYDSFSKFCADTVLFGQAFTDNCTEMTGKELIRFLKRQEFSPENRELFRRFPKGFKINWDREKGEIICYRFLKPSAWFVFEKEKGVWKLKVLGVYFPEERK